MPILNITAADVKKLEALEDGWYSAKIQKISDLSASKKGDSSNLIVNFLIENTEGKEIDHYFNTKLIGTIAPLIEAATGKKDKEYLSFDTDILLNKHVDVKIVRDVYNGNITNKIASFLPHGKGKDQKAPY